MAHSPDADDAFMFYALFQNKIDLGGLSFEEVQEDIETLNRKAAIEGGAYDVSAVSFSVFPAIQDKYRLLPVGACFGEGYGPIIVSQKALKPRQLLKVRLGIPGKHTTAFLVLKLFELHLAGEGKSGICYSETPFDQIMDNTASGRLDAGLIIHEGQLTFEEKGLHKITDLGEWWGKQTGGLPLPLGGIVIRRDLDPAVQIKVAEIIQASVRYALEHREEALEFALPFARGLDRGRTNRFIEMYVNDMTVDFGRKGLKAIKGLFEMAFRHGLLTQEVDLDESLLRVRGPKKLSVEPEIPVTPEIQMTQVAPDIHDALPDTPPVQRIDETQTAELAEEPASELPPDVDTSKP